jgi:transcriptional regulator with XRE-family HTH domain
MEAQTLGEAIEQRRGELGLSIAGASKRAGVARSTWQQIERGVRLAVHSKTLAQMDQALQLSPGTLYNVANNDGVSVHELERVETFTFVIPPGELEDDTHARRRLMRIAQDAPIDQIWDVLHEFVRNTQARETEEQALLATMKKLWKQVTSGEETLG